MSQRRPHRCIRFGRRPLTCYHEAGHCLARWWFGHSFYRVLVLTMDEAARGVQSLNHRGMPIADVEGFIDCYDLVSPTYTPSLLDSMGGEPDLITEISRNTRVLAEMILIENFIGAAAEARYRKCGFDWALLTGGGGDLAQARQTLDTWFPDPKARNAAELQAEQHAMALLRSGAGWQAITALANALMDHGELRWIEAEPAVSGLRLREAKPERLDESLATVPRHDPQRCFPRAGDRLNGCFAPHDQFPRRHLRWPGREPGPHCARLGAGAG